MGPGTLVRFARAAGWRVFLPLLASPLCAAATITVGTQDAADYTGIQEAIDAAADGDTVLVGGGVYVVSVPITFRGKAIAVRSVSGPQDTIVRMSSTPADPARASVFVFENGEGSEAALEGFTITGGSGTYHAPSWGSPFTAGGGVFVVEAAPRLANCTVRYNASMFSGGIFLDACGSRIESCRVSDNRALVLGGGIGAFRSSAVFDRCEISGNTAESGAGAELHYSPDARFDGCTFAGNTAIIGDSPFSPLGIGGALKASNGSDAVLTDCVFVGNRAEAYGGAVAAWGTTPSFSDCLFHGNSAEIGGGALWTYWDGGVTLTNCTVSGNEAGEGGGIYLDENTSGRWCRVHIANCIVWGNGGPGPADLIDRGFGVETGLLAPVSVRYSCIGGGEYCGEEGAICADPRFVDPVRNDYRLRPDSPCVDAGDPESPQDADGTRADIGALPFAAASFTRGDANGDRSVDIADAVYVLGYLFAGAESPGCMDAADVNDDGAIDIADAAAVLEHLFGDWIVPGPFPERGRDETADGLGCESY